MTDYPTTPAELFDLCQELFGIGDYDEDAKADVPWFKVRMNEIGKLRRFLDARRIEVRSMAIAAHYCHDQGITIRVTGELIPYIAPALMKMRQDADRLKLSEYEARINRAAQAALARGLDETAERLMRMPMAGSEDVLTWIEKQLGITP